MRTNYETKNINHVLDLKGINVNDLIKMFENCNRLGHSFMGAPTNYKNRE